MSITKKISFIFVAIAVVITVAIFIFNMMMAAKNLQTVKNIEKTNYYEDNNVNTTDNASSTTSDDSLKNFSDLPMWDKMTVVFVERKVPKLKEEILDFCLNGFNFSNTADNFLGRYGEKKENENDHGIAYKRIVFLEKIFKGEDFVCKNEVSKEFCDNIASLKNISYFLLNRDNVFCQQFDKEAETVCAVFDKVKTDKKIILSKEVEKMACSVDKGEIGETIKYYIDGDSQIRECQSDSGHIFNTVLAYANKDAIYCNNINKSGHEAYRDLCEVAAENGNTDKKKDNFKKDFCVKFSESLQ